MSVELRVVTPDDWELWRAVRLEALAQAPYAFGSTLEDWAQADERRWRDRLELPGSHNLVAVRVGRPVGMVSGVPAEEPDSAALISMYVVPAVRGTGVAGLLLDAVAEWAVGRGARRLCLDVRGDNAAARRVYERQGFVVTGEVERTSPADPLELRMCRTLDARTLPA